MHVQDAIEAMDNFAPSHLAAEWDNVGLIVGDPDDTLRGPVLITIDLTPVVADEAITLGTGMLIAYHPPIFRPIKRLGTTPRERALLRLIRAGAAVYSPHTALDAAPGGMSEWLLESCAPSTVSDVRAIETAPVRTHSHKLVTFAPADAIDAIRSALAKAGAGIIGAYTHCSFMTPGTGTFLGDASTNPAVGERGKLETVHEIRLETVCGVRDLPEVIAALRRSHPYEEPAFDLFPLEAVPDGRSGSGRVGTLAEPVSAGALAQHVGRSLGVPVKLAAPEHGPPITRLGVCPGAGSSLIEPLRIAPGTAFVTGEMSHHEVLAAVHDLGGTIVLAGHTNTERPFLHVLRERLAGALRGVGVRIAMSDRAPFGHAG